MANVDMILIRLTLKNSKKFASKVSFRKSDINLKTNSLIIIGFLEYFEHTHIMRGSLRKVITILERVCFTK